MFSFARFVTSVYYLTRFKLKPPVQRLSEPEVSPLVLWGGGWTCAQGVGRKFQELRLNLQDYIGLN